MRRSVRPMIGVLAILTAAACAPPDPLDRYAADVAGGDAVTFLLEFTDEAAYLHRLKVPSQRRSDTRAPTLIPGEPAASVLGHGEIVASVHGPQGEQLEAIALQGRPVDFLEALPPDRGPRTGGRLVRRATDLRRLVVPTSADARSIVFYRIDVIPGGGRPPALPTGSPTHGPIDLRDALVGADVDVPAADHTATYRVRPLGAWLLDPDFTETGLDIPGIGDAWSLDPAELDKHMLAILLAEGAYMPKDILGSRPKEWGSIEPRVERLHEAGELTDRFLDAFDIVILSEGFEASELATFDSRTDEFVEELFGSPGWEPFVSLEHLINVYRVAFASNDSGVEFCPSESTCSDVADCRDEVTCVPPSSEWSVCSSCWSACEDTGAACADCLGCSPSGCDNFSCGWSPESCRECAECTGCGSSCADECDDCHACYAECADECDALFDCTYCTDTPLDTWLEVEGNFDDRCAITDFKATDEALVWEAAARAVPDETIDLIIVMVNCVFYGGRAMSDDPIAYVSVMHPDERDNAEQLANAGATMAEYFTGLAVHESAHAMANLGEEYATCAVYEAGNDYENQADADARDGAHTSTVWWAELADGSELTGTDFKAVTDCDAGDAPDGGFGLHWGAQFYDVEDVAGDGWYYGPCSGQDVRAGCGWYRPTQECAMSVWTEKLCRVCVDVLGRAIEEAVGPTVVAPPGVPVGLNRSDTLPD